MCLKEMISMRKFVVALCICCTLFGGTATAVDLGDLLGVVGGGFLVKTIAGPINDFINTVTFNKGVGVEESTKVVPIVSFGSGTRIGAAQVAGPDAAVGKTKAVARLNLSFQGKVGVNVLIPIDAENPLERFRRVQGVGVSAIIDYNL